jgi:hypothetical protein
MKIKLFAALVLLILTPAAAQVTYDIDNSQESANVSAEVTVDCNRFNCPRLTWGKPSGFELVNVTGPEGEITNYEETSDSVEIDTGSSDGRDTKTITINMRTSEPPKEVYRGLYKRELSLSAFEGDTQGTVESINLISGDVGHGFATVYGEERYNFSGEGPVNIDINFGEGEQTRYYALFGEHSEKSYTPIYEIVVGTTGQVQGYERIPVAVIPDSVYNQTQSRWSAGEYSSGTIRLRASLGEDFNKTLAHETVHAVNADVLSWDATTSSYIDEGTAKYVEYLVDRQSIPASKRDDRVRKLFGGEVSYTTTIDGQRYRITKPSRGDREVLWNYYQQDSGFMKDWSPSRSEYRDFGYAYSELIIRHNILEKNINLSDMYSYFNKDQKIRSPETKWQELSEDMDLTPCKTDNRTEFNNCLDRVNNHSLFTAYTAEPERGNENLVVKRKEPPQLEGGEKFNETVSGNETVVEKIGGRQKFAAFVGDLVNYVVESILRILGQNR